MRNFLKITLCILVSLIIISFSGCKLVEDLIGRAIVSCVPKEGPLLYYGDFEYCYVNSASDNRKRQQGEYVAILGITKSAMQKETIIIPETIENKPVILIGMRGFKWEYDIDDGIYNKIYIPNTIEQIRNDGIYNGNKKRFLLNKVNDLFFKSIGGIFYVPQTDYKYYEEYFNLNETVTSFDTIKIANLTYMVDGNVYWIDDYENGEYVKFPKNPQREGYVFGGWYKDLQYSTYWDNEIDAYHKPDNEDTVYLYAKWIENQEWRI